MRVRLTQFLSVQEGTPRPWAIYSHEIFVYFVSHLHVEVATLITLQIRVKDKILQPPSVV